MVELITKSEPITMPITEKANKIVSNHARVALGAGLVPIPLVDLAILTGIQLRMLYSLAKLYKVEFSEHLGKSLIAALIDSAMPTFVSVQVASVIKAAPIIGLASGMVTVSLLGSACTFAVGKVFIQHFASGGTLLNFDPQEMQAYFNAQYEKAQSESRTNFVGIRP